MILCRFQYDEGFHLPRLIHLYKKKSQLSKVLAWEAEPHWRVSTRRLIRLTITR